MSQGAPTQLWGTAMSVSETKLCLLFPVSSTERCSRKRPSGWGFQARQPPRSVRFILSRAPGARELARDVPRQAAVTGGARATSSLGSLLGIHTRLYDESASGVLPCESRSLPSAALPAQRARCRACVKMTRHRPALQAAASNRKVHGMF